MDIMQSIRLLSILSLSLVMAACTGTRPAHLGGALTSLQACPDSPNCVSSLADQSDDEHYIAPFAIRSSSQENPISQVALIIKQNSKADIIVQSDHYLYAEYTSDLMRFVDDVEFLFDTEEKVVHVRSASRLGHKDFGVNRDRIEAIRAELIK